MTRAGILGSLLSLLLLCAPAIHAQETTPNTFTTATVTQIQQEQEIPTDTGNRYIQTLAVSRTDTGETVSLQAGSRFQPLEAHQRLHVGQRIVISSHQLDEGTVEWALVDTAYRLPTLLVLTLVFLTVVVVVARLQGAFSILGMLSSAIILFAFIIPQILSGAQPLLISFIGSIIIAACSMYISHGVSRKTHIAFASIVVTLFVVLLLASIVLSAARMSGLGTEEAAFLQLEPGITVNLRGLLLAGIVLGTLGVLDDICISQVSIVRELLEAKPHSTVKELIVRALSVGKDHIASLVNTLILAYAGSSLPLFLLFSLHNTRPLWVTLNDEMIAEEIVRTLVGSMGLVLAIPFTTVVAAVLLKRS